MLKYQHMNVAFKDSGKGIPVILLHAFPLSAEMWEPQINALVSAGYRVIAPDFRGFGKTGLPAGKTTMEDLAEDIKVLCDKLEIDQAVIGGLSMGGYAALNLYRLYPEKFAGMILADTAAFADTEEKREWRRHLIVEIESHGMEAVIEKMLPSLTSEYSKNTQPELITKLEESCRKTDYRAAIAALLGMTERKDHTGLLSKITVPTLLVFGENDDLTKLDTAETLRKNIPDSKLEVIKHAGHYSNLEDTSEFNRILLDFLDTLK